MKTLLRITIGLFLLGFIGKTVQSQSPTLVSNPSNARYCEGTDGVRLGVSNSETAIVYTLQLNSGGWQNVSTVEGDGGTVYFQDFWTAGSYRLGAPHTSNTVNVQLTSYPEQKFNIIGGGGYCEGLQQDFEIGLDGSQTGVSYRLFWNGVQVQGSSTNGTGNPISFGIFDQTGVYTATGSRFSLCSVDMIGSVTIAEFQNPLPDFSYIVPGAPDDCSTVIFSNETTGGTQPYEFHWDFGDGTVSTVENPTHIFPAFGTGQQTFNVTLTVTDANGCENVYSNDIIVTRRPDAGLFGSGFPQFTNCDPDPNAIFLLTITNISTTLATNVNYWVDWYGDGTLVNLGPGFTTSQHTYMTKGSFPLTFIVEGENGCFDTRVYNVFNGSTPAMGMQTAQLEGCAPFLIDFKMTPSVYNNTPSTIYTFNFGDGSPTLVLAQENLPPPDMNGFCVIPHTYLTASCGQPGNAYTMSALAQNPCADVPYNVGGIKISIKANASFDIFEFPNDPIYLCVGQQHIFHSYTDVGCLIVGGNFTTITSYHWDFGDGMGTSNQEHPTYTYQIPGVYQVTLIAHTAQGINGNCGTDTSIRTVCVQDPPTASFSLNATSGCAPFEFTPNNTSSAAGCSNIRYQWIVSPDQGYGYDNFTHSQSAQPNFVFYDAGIYTLQLNARTWSRDLLCGEDYSQEITITVMDVPEIIFADGDFNMICETGSFTFNLGQLTYSDNYSPINQYLWTINPPVPVFVDNAVPYPTVIFNSYGTFLLTVIATNSCGDSEPTNISITISPDIDNNTISYNGNLELCDGMTLSNLIEGAEPPLLSGGNGVYAYSWEINTGNGWEPVQGGMGANLLYEIGFSHNPTMFRREVKSAGCESYSDILTFIVHPEIAANSILTPHQHICTGETPQMLDGAQPSGGDGEFDFLWQQSTDCNNPDSWVSAIGGANNQEDFAPGALDVTTCFRRIVYSVSDFCEDISDYVLVNVYGEIQSNSITHPNPVICQGTAPGIITGSLPLQAGHSLAFQYIWYKAVGPLWEFVEAGGTGQNFAPPQLDVTTRFRRLAKSPNPIPANCNEQYSNEIEIAVNQNPIVDAGINQTIFNGGIVLLSGTASGGTGDYSYLWTPAELIATGQGTPVATTVNLFPPPNLIVFCLRVTDNETGCWREDCMDVTIFGESLMCTATANPTAICLGEEVILSVNAMGGSGVYNFDWTLPGGGTMTGASITHTPVGTGALLYTVEVNDGATTSQCEVTVQVNALPVMNSSPTITICSGQQINYTPSANLAGATFTWFSGFNPFITGGTAGDGEIDDVLFNLSNEVQTIIYNIMPVGPQQTLCVGDNFELLVTVNPLAEIVNSPTQQTVVSGQFSTDVTFNSNVNGSSFNWSSSDDCPGILNYFTPNSGNVLPTQLIEIIDPNGPETCIITFYITPEFEGCPGMTYEYKIYVQQQPVLFSVTGGGQICQGGSTSIHQSGSQTGVNYQLYRNGTIPVQPEKIGDGSPIVWSGVSIGGVYTVVGINQANMVHAQMSGQVAVVVNPLPQIFVLVPQGDRCAPVTPMLSGSQAGVRYYLIRNGQFIVQELDGTGLSEFLVFNEQTEDGIYTINAIVLSTLCEEMMNGQLILHPLPEEFPIIPGGILCVGTILQMQTSQPGIEYQLWLNDDPFGDFHIGDGGPISFEMATLPGTYRVFANDPIWGCDRFFSQEVIINPTPLQFEATPGVCCPGCSIVLNGWQTGVDYYLYFEDPADYHRILPVLGPIQGVFGQPTINFGQWWDEGTYTVLAKNSSECEMWMLNATIIKNAPDTFSMIPNGTGCGQQEILMDGSEIGVTYFIYKDLQIEDSLIGTGLPISFGIYDIAGVYTVKAKFNDPLIGCWSQMTGSYEIIAYPTAFIIDPIPGIYCPCVDPELSSSQAGINYYLENTTLGTESFAYPGTGNPLSLDPVCEPGTYVIFALHPDYPSCKKYMTGGFTISLPPQVHNLSGPLPSAFCENGNGVTLTLDNSQTDVKYQLYRIPNIPIGAPKDGINGTSITWSNITAGVFFVEAVFANDPNCPTTMNNFVTVEEIPLPTVYAGDDGSICRSDTYEVPNVMMTYNSSFTWTVISGLGILQNLNTLNPTYIPVDEDAGTTVQLQLEVNGISACSAESAIDFVSIQIDPLPLIDNPGDNGTICFDQTFTVSNVLLNNVSDWFWTVTIGNGALDDPNLLNPTYIPAPGDAGTSVLITLEAAGNLACISEIASDVVSIQIDPVPMVVSATTRTICSGESVNYTPLSDIPGTTFTWASTNTTLGCISGNTASGSGVINDVLNNSCNTVQTIKYTIIPMGPSTSNCIGSSAELIVTINPVASITNTTVEQSMNSNELSADVVFETDIVGVPVNYTWSGIASHTEIQGWVESGAGDLPQMNIWIDESGTNPPDYGAIEYTVTPFVNGCLGNPFTYTIHVYLLPTVFNFVVQGSGEFCNDGLTCIDITLNYSQAGKIYKIYWNTIYQSGLDLDGINASLIWCVNQPGVYTVKAYNPNTGVEIWMNGTAEVISRQVPLNFTLAIQAPGNNCIPITPRLNGSEVGAFYDLYFDDGVNPEPVLVQEDAPGTGNALIFEIQNQPGSYYVIAKLPFTEITCDRQMSGIINADAMPTEYVLTSNNGFCAGLDEICLTNSETDVNYCLYKGNNPYGPVIPGNNGVLCFGIITQPGIYRIHAKKVNSMCELFFQQQVEVYPVPVKYAVSPVFACSGTEITLNNCQEGIDYYLYWQPDASDFTREWILMAGPLACSDGSPVSFGSWNDVGVYRIKGVSLWNCESWMQNTTTILPKPSTFEIQPQGFTGCQPITIYLDDFDELVTYYLWREDSQGNLILAGTDDGLNGDVNFGLQSLPGIYTIKAKWTHPSLDCWSDMTGSIAIGNAPELYIMRPVAPTCPPVGFYLSNSENGVLYQLHSAAAGLIEEISGEGSAIYFDLVDDPDDYWIIAKNLLGCEIQMEGVRTVLEMPDAYSVTLANGNICIDESIVIGVSWSDVGFSYELHRVAASNNPLDIQAGIDAPLLFAPANQLVAGIYRVKSVDNLSGCSKWMNNSITIHDPPDIYEITANGQVSQSFYYCPPVTIGLNFSEVGIVYALERDNEQVAFQVGTGASLDFGTWTEPGNYIIIANDLITTCDSEMNGFVNISDGPASYNLVADNPLYCIGDSQSVTLTLADSQIGVEYQLYKDDLSNPVSVVKIGTNSALHWESVSQYGSGNYFVIAKFSGSPDCEAPMLNAITLHELPLPTASLSNTSIICEGYCTQIPVELTGNILDWSLTYSVNGEYRTDIFPVAGPHFLEICSSGLDQIVVQLVEIKYSDAPFCEGTVTGTHTVFIQPLPVADAGQDATVCESSGIYSLSSAVASNYSSVSWIVNGVGSLDNPATVNPNFSIPDIDEPAVVEFILTAFGANECSSEIVTSTFTLQIDPMPNVFAGNNTTICESAMLLFPLGEATAEFFSSVIWQVAGPGFLDNPSVLNPNYLVPDVNEPTLVDFILTATGTGECSGNIVSSTFTLQIDPLPNIFAGGDATVCESTGIYFLSEATAVYYTSLSWSVASGFGSFDNPTSLNPGYLIPEVNQPTTVELVLTAIGNGECSGSVVSSSFTLQIDPLPEIFAGDDVTVCEASGLYQLTNATANYYSELLWSLIGEVGEIDNPTSLNPNFIIPDIIAPASVEIVLTAIGTGKCVGEPVSSSFTILIEPIPIIFAGNDSTICESDEVFFLSQASAYYYSEVLWEVNGTGAFDDPSLLNPNFLPPNITEPTIVELVLHVTGTGTCNAENISDTLILLINPLPIVFAGNDATVCESAGIFTLYEASAEYYSELDWEVIGVGSIDDPAALNPNYLIPDISQPTLVELRLNVVGFGECANGIVSHSFFLQIEPLPQVFAGNNATVCEAEGAFPLSEAVAEYYSALSWSVNGPGFIDDPTSLNPIYTIPDVTEPTMIELFLKAYGTGECAGDIVTSGFYLQIDPLPELDAGASLAVCAVDQIHIIDASAEFYSNLLWTIDNGLGSFDDNTKIDPVFIPNPSTAGSTVTLTLTAISTGFCSEIFVTMQKLITINRLPEVEAGSGGIVCYEFNGNSAIVIPGGDAWVNHASSFEWSLHPEMLNFGYLDGENTLTPTFYPYPPGAGKTVSLMLTATGDEQCIEYKASDLCAIKVGSQPMVQFNYVNNNQDSTLCCCSPVYFVDLTFFGQNFPKHPDQVISKRMWDFGDNTGIHTYTFETTVSHIYAEPGTYVVKLFIETGIDGMISCTGSYQTTVTINSLPTPDFGYTQVNYCDGNIQFTDLSQGFNISKYWWKFEDGINSYYSDIQNPQFEYLTGGIKTVTFTVTDQKGCTNEIIKTIEVKDFFNFDIQHEGNCFDDTFRFWLDPETLFPIGNTVVNYQWSFGDGSPVNRDSLAIHEFNFAGNHTVLLIAEDQSGCERIKSYSVFVPGQLLPEFNFNECEETVHFTDLTPFNGNEIQFWIWNFGDGTIDTIHPPESPNISHTYPERTTYTVSLTVIDAMGCEATITVDTVRTVCLDIKGLFVPNAMYPEYSNDPNDEVRYFKPKGINIAEYHMQVFDLWGSLIWESKLLDNNGSPIEAWDGTYKNNLVPPGNYLWKAYAKFKDGTVWFDESVESNGEQGTTTGTVIVIR